jgi:GntR family transcriptional regulator
VSATPERAAQLTVRPGAPLLLIERVSYSQQNIPIEFLRVSHRGDRYVLYNELRG